MTSPFSSDFRKLSLGPISSVRFDTVTLDLARNNSPHLCVGFLFFVANPLVARPPPPPPASSSASSPHLLHHTYHLIISSSHHLIISSSHHFIISSSSHHLIISSSHHLIISSCHHHLISSSHHLILISSSSRLIISSSHHLISVASHHTSIDVLTFPLLFHLLFLWQALLRPVTRVSEFVRRVLLGRYQHTAHRATSHESGSGGGLSLSA